MLIPLCPKGGPTASGQQGLCQQACRSTAGASVLPDTAMLILLSFQFSDASFYTDDGEPGDKILFDLNIWFAAPEETGNVEFLPICNLA